MLMIMQSILLLAICYVEYILDMSLSMLSHVDQ